VFLVSAMPCNEGEVYMNALEAVPPCTPLKATGYGRAAGAGRVDPEGQMNSNSENSDELQSAMSKRKRNDRAENYGR
jgi:hypothetical protein